MRFPRLLTLLLIPSLADSASSGQTCSGWDKVAIGGRSSHAMAYDVTRGVTVLFGGHDGDVDGQTWEWDGQMWTRKATLGPSPRYLHAMAFDPVRHVTVLFGGRGNTDSNNETWEWDGNLWTLRFVGGPSPRRGHAMVFDAARNVAVLHGGKVGGPTMDSTTWEWDGTSWSLRSTIGPPRAYHSMAFDVQRGITVLFGGQATFSGFYGDPYFAETWEWDGRTWNLRATTGPTARIHAAFADEPGSGVVLVGGETHTESLGDTWRWNGIEWMQVPSLGPSARSNAAMVHDIARNVLTLFSGDNLGVIKSDTWEWNGREWQQRSIGSPAPRTFGGFAFDSHRQVAVIFGGTEPLPVAPPPYPAYGDTWEWDGVAWVLRATDGPTPRKFTAMCFDSARKVSVLFGGRDPIDPNGETWEWDGQTWLLRAEDGPSPRLAHSMCYDQERHKTVLFSGFPYNQETWEWNGITWELRATTGPLPRREAAMVYDENRKVSVLFGGFGGGGGELFQDTWEWDGATWTQRSLDGPPKRHAHQMAYEPLRKCVVLYGGIGIDYLSGYFLKDVWTWNGSIWSSYPDAEQYRAGGMMIADTTAQSILLFGGANSNTYKCDTWHFNLRGPTIVQQPLSVLTPPTSSVLFTIQAFGEGAIHYQWQRFGLNLVDGGSIAGAQTTTLTISPATGANWGDYQVQVADSNCAIMSNVALLRIIQQCDVDIVPNHGGDGVVNIDELLEVISNWGNCWTICPADFDGNHVVNIDDLLAVITAWGPCR